MYWLIDWLIDLQVPPTINENELVADNKSNNNNNKPANQAREKKKVNKVHVFILNKG